MLVGEVRRASTAAGPSCRLSGGSQWSSGPTKVSKKAQVLRDTRRRNAVCPGESLACGRASGRPSHHTTSGDASHRSRIGAATASAPGRACNRYNIVVIARNGAIHIQRKESRRPVLLLPSSWPEGVHSRKRRRVTSRTALRRIAPRLKQGSQGR